MHIAPIRTKHPSGEDIYLFTLRNENGMEICISNYGAIVSSWKWPHVSGRLYELLLGFDSMDDYFNPAYLENYPWMGAAIGRYANRIKNGQFTIGEKTYQLPLNNFNDHLHGGDAGFDKVIWQVLSHNNHELVLSFTSADGTNGYPGNLEVQLAFTLREDGFGYRFTATTDRATPVNLTHHGYFNLNDGKGPINDHEIRIPAAYYLAQGENFVPDGTMAPVAASRFDFRSWQQIAANENTGEGYDQSFVVSDKKEDQKISLVAEARSAASGLHLQVFSNEPVVHFYTGRWIPVVQGHHGIQYGPFSGFCLETQVHPNAINNPSFPDTLLHPGETYLQETFYKITSY